jgi:CRP/FNR family cyclic AMP-dependent transcriptional regulator
VTLTAVAVTALAEMPLFRDVPLKHLARVAELLEPRFCRARTPIVTGDEPGDGVCIVLDGSVKVFVETSDGNRVVLAILTAGELVGEMSTVDRLGRSATVVTHEDSVLLWMEHAAFWDCLRNTPHMSFNLATILSRRLRVANAQIQTLSTLDVVGRVARQFLTFADAYGRPGLAGGVLIPFRLTQSDLAGFIGCSRVRVNQVLVHWKARGYLAVDDDLRVTLYDLEALERACARPERRVVTTPATRVKNVTHRLTPGGTAPMLRPRIESPPPVGL